MKLIKRTVNLSLTALIIFSAVPFTLSTQSASAATASDWQAGKIIEDNLFTDSSSMSVQQIQDFLNQKVPQCDSQGLKNVSYYYNPTTGQVGFNNNFGGSWTSTTRTVYAQRYNEYYKTTNAATPFTCLKDYYEVPKLQPGLDLPVSNANGAPIPSDSKSAAELIWDAAQKNHISPKVLLVKLGTESSGPLTSDDWPFRNQYLYAMGAHCPDSGPGGSANCDPKYAGFSIQMNEAASLLRWYLDSMTQPWWTYKKPYQTNYILWNVEPTGCGGANLFLTTKSAAALYTYTPYQPNKAALDNMYGKGDGCSSYGNRNFWRVYTDWFGIPTYGFTKSSADSNYAKSACTIPYYTSLYVGRLYQPDTRDYLYTTNQAEACQAIRIGYIWDGIVFKNAQDSNGAIPIYRLSGIDRHIYTSSTSVRDDYTQTKGYKLEGIEFYALPNADSSTTPVYGLQKDYTFFITSSGKEAELSQDQGFNPFGTIFYTQKLEGSRIPVYRLMRNHSRLYTTSNIERNSALNQFGFVDEGTITINDASPNEANAPIYRLRSPSGEYFYTISRYERDAAVILYGYYSEGIGFYALLYSTAPAYRANDPMTARRIYTNSLLEYKLAQELYKFTGENVGWYGYGD